MKSKDKGPKGPKQEPMLAQECSKKNDGFWHTTFSLLRHFWHVILEIAAVVGLLALIYPRISVSSSPSLNESNPFATPFVITNDGLFPIYDVTFKCFLNNVSLPRGAGVKNGWTTWGENPIPQINGNHSETTFCPFPFARESEVVAADIFVEATFKTFWFPPTQTISFRFKTLKGVDGKLYWYPHEK